MGLISASIDSATKTLNVVQDSAMDLPSEQVIVTVQGPDGFRQVLSPRYGRFKVDVPDIDATYRIHQRLGTGRATRDDVLIVKGTEEIAAIVEDEDDLYDPGEWNIADVKAHLAANPDDLSRVVSEEYLGKKRNGILELEG